MKVIKGIFLKNTPLSIYVISVFAFFFPWLQEDSKDLHIFAVPAVLRTQPFYGMWLLLFSDCCGGEGSVVVFVVVSLSVIGHFLCVCGLGMVMKIIIDIYLNGAVDQKYTLYMDKAIYIYEKKDLLFDVVARLIEKISTWPKKYEA